MRPILCALAALTLMAPAVGHAQDQHDRRDQAQQHGRGAVQEQPQASQPQSGPSRMQRQAPPQLAPAPLGRAAPAPTRPGFGRAYTPPVTLSRAPNTYRAPPARPGEYRPGTIGQMFHYGGRAPNRIRAPGFRFPSGYHYVRYNIGSRIPPIFLAAPFFFTDYYALGIEPPPPGYRWVRDGSDLLLVDLYTDEVVDVIYDAFY